MSDDATGWPKVGPPPVWEADRDAGAQRHRLRAAIDRLGADAGAEPEQDGDADARAAEADMLGLLVALEGDAAEALGRALTPPDEGV